MQQNGLGGKQVAQVRGFADQFPRKPDKPFDPANRRISVIVQNLDNHDARETKTTDAVNTIPDAAN